MKPQSFALHLGVVALASYNRAEYASFLRVPAPQPLDAHRHADRTARQSQLQLPRVRPDLQPHRRQQQSDSINGSLRRLRYSHGLRTLRLVRGQPRHRRCSCIDLTGERNHESDLTFRPLHLNGRKADDRRHRGKCGTDHTQTGKQDGSKERRFQMASVNKVILVGNLGRDPETRYTPDGAAICNVSIATTSQWKDKASGERKEETECTAYVLSALG